MSAFSTNTRRQIQQNINALFTRRHALARLAITHEEYIQTFVPMEARDLFRNIAPYNGNANLVRAEFELRQFTNYSLTGLIYVRGDHKPAPPIVKNHELQPDAPPEVVARIRTWVETGGDVPRDFGRVSKLFGVLSDGYSRNAIRHYWPSIMALCDGNDVTQDLVVELQNLKMASSPKPLPPGLVVACRKTSETIATARLIPPDVRPQEFGDVTLDVAPNQRYMEEDLGTFFGMA